MRNAQIRRLNPLDYSGTEAVNTICSNLSFAGMHLRKVVLTSCNSGDGKSYMTMQIACNLASRGKRVVLVDADLRKSNLVSRYGITCEGEMTGLVHYLAGYDRLEDVIYRTNVENMHLLPAGRDIANPIPLLDSPAFSELLDFLASKYDIVMVDAPPVGLVIDAAEIARYCDGVILVVKHICLCAQYAHAGQLAGTDGKRSGQLPQGQRRDGLCSGLCGKRRAQPFPDGMEGPVCHGRAG